MSGDKVVIVGSNQYTRHLIDWDQNADYWLFNEAGNHSWAKRCDAVFQMHLPDIWRNLGNVNDKNHYMWLQNTEIPVYMQDHYDDVRTSIKYPLNEICQALLPGIIRKSGDQVRYFTSSPAYAIALAIYLNYDVIEIVGIEMSSNTEYLYQRDGVMFWIGIATGRGIKVIIQDKSLLFKSKLYGYDGEIVIHRQRFEIVSKTIAPLVEKKKVEVYDATTRATQLIELFLDEKNGEFRQDNGEKLVKSIQDMVDKAIEFGMLSGALNENYKYISEVDELIKAAGGERTLQSLEGKNDNH